MKHLRHLTALPTVVLLAGCSTVYVDKGEVENRTLLPFQEVVVFEKNPKLKGYEPRCIRVLKFLDPQNKDPDEIFRKAFHAQLSVTGVRLIPLQAEITENSAKCDLELRGKVLANDKTFLGVYSDYKAAVEIELFHVGQKEYFWRGKHEMSKKSGGLPLDPLSSIVGIFNASTNIGSDQDGKLAYELASRIVSKIPNLSYQADRIPEVATPLKAEATIETPLDFLRRVSDLAPDKKIIEFRSYLEKNKALPKKDLALLSEEWLKIDATNIELGLKVLNLRFEAKNHAGVMSLSEALEATTQGLEPAIYETRAKSFTSLGNYESAAKDQVKVIALGRRTASTFLGLGKTYGAMGRFDLSVAALTKATELDPNNSEVLLYLGVSQAAQGDKPSSYEALRRALVMNISRGDSIAAKRVRAAMLNTETYELLTSKDKAFVEKTLQVSTKEES